MGNAGDFCGLARRPLLLEGPVLPALHVQRFRATGEPNRGQLQVRLKGGRRLPGIGSLCIGCKVMSFAAVGCAAEMPCKTSMVCVKTRHTLQIDRCKVAV